jgi:uncharacterized phage infection (PIP) family protein YhgE
MDILFGSGKTVPEEYNNTDGKMPLLDGADQIQVFFNALGGNQAGKYRIIAQKITGPHDDRHIAKDTQYVVDPNDKSVNKAVVQAIVSELNGGEEKVAEPEPDVSPVPPTPQKTIEKLLEEIETAVENTSVDTSKIIANAESIKEAADKIKEAADKIKEAADEIKAAADEIKAAADEIKAAADEIKEEDAETKSADEDAVKERRADLYAKIKSAVEKIKTADAKIRALIVVPTSKGGYNSAKSAAPKRITRMRRTRRSAKLAGTRRRRRLTY